MLQGWVIVTVSFAYLGVLFAIAYYGDKRADAGRSIIAKPTIYALSLAVYCTTWTFYGSVGRAASTGIGFLPIYLGPTLMAGLWWFVMLKIIRISKANRITSIADFVASRYGKSQMLGGLVTVIAVVGIIPYISLQLKAVSNTFTILLHYPEIIMPARAEAQPLFQDSALYIAMILAAFTILFGTRHLDATERHEGMVAAIAFESLVKLLAFLAVGAFVTFGIYNGFGDIFDRAEAVPRLKALMTVADSGTSYANWWSLTFLSMLSIMLLPRQFQISVVENVDEQHLAQGHLAVPALPAAYQHLRPAHHAGRTAALPRRQRGCRYVRADPAHGRASASAGAVCVHRRPFGGHRHGDRGNHRPVYHGLQRPGDAGPAAATLDAPALNSRIFPGCCCRFAAGQSPASYC